MIEKARKQRRDLAGCSREELLLAALEELVAGPVVDPVVKASASSELEHTDRANCTRVHWLVDGARSLAADHWVIPGA